MALIGAVRGLHLLISGLLLGVSAPGCDGSNKVGANEAIVFDTTPADPGVVECKQRFPASHGLGPDLDMNAVWQKCMDVVADSGRGCDPSRMLTADAAACVAELDGLEMDLQWRVTLQILHGPPTEVVWSVVRPDGSDFRLVHAHTGAIVPPPKSATVREVARDPGADNSPATAAGGADPSH